MTTSAWIFMLTVWIVVVVMTIYCFVRLLTSRQFAEAEGDAEHTPAFGGPEDD